MSVSEYSLATLAEVRRFLGKTVADTVDDVLLEEIIERVSELIELEASRNFKARSYTEYHDGDGVDDSIILNQAPIITVTGIWDDIDREFADSTKLASSDYVIDSELGRVRLIDKNTYSWIRKLAFNRGYQNIKIQFTAGWVSLPKPLTGATCEEVAFRYRKIKDKRLGLSSQSGQGGSRVFFPHRILPEVMEVIDLYRRVVFQTDPPRTKN